MKTNFIISLILSSIFITGCTEDERRELLEIAKDATMSESEKRAKRQAEEYARKKEEMEYIHASRYENLIQRAEAEIRSNIANHLKKHNVPYSQIIIYDGYIHSPNNAKTPDESLYTYRVDFSADVIRDDFLVLDIKTLNGYVNFDFQYANEDSYTVNWYNYEHINTRTEFSDISKLLGKTLFDKLTESDNGN